MIDRWSVRRATSVTLLAAALLLGPWGSVRVSAQEDARERSGWFPLWSRPNTVDRILVGQATWHAISKSREGVQNDRMIALVYRGYFAGTFRTTHGPRGWAVGLERDWISGTWGPARLMLGFRTGLVYGYDERLGWLAGEVPILPFGSPLIQGNVGPLTLDFSYTWVVLSLTAGIGF